MTALAVTDDLFFTRAGMDRARIEGVVGEALAGADDGELYLEYCQSESLSWDDGKLKSANFDTTQGFGLRAVAGEACGFAHASALDEAAVRRAAQTVAAIKAGHSGVMAEAPAGTNKQLYSPDNPLPQVDFAAKVKLLADIDAYVRAKEPKVKQVSCSISGEWQAVQIIRADGRRAADLRPLVRLSVSVVAQDGTRMEMGGHGGGGRVDYADFFQPDTWRAYADEALRQALVNLDSVPAPAGEMMQRAQLAREWGATEPSASAAVR